MHLLSNQGVIEIQQ